MSFLHIEKEGYHEVCVRLDDGVSDLCHRYVDLDKGTVHSVMGKQLAGKDVNPMGKVGQEALTAAFYIWNRLMEKEKEETANG